MILNWLVVPICPASFNNEYPQILSTEKINMILLHCSLESVTYILIIILNLVKVQSLISQ